MDNFETKLKTLEELSEKIKRTDIPLEEAVEIFEKGIKLSKTLEKDLEKIESKVMILMNQPVKASETEQEIKPELDLFNENYL